MDLLERLDLLVLPALTEAMVLLGRLDLRDQLALTQQFLGLRDQRDQLVRLVLQVLLAQLQLFLDLLVLQVLMVNHLVITNTKLKLLLHLVTQLAVTSSGITQLKFQQLK
jgi:hypothetical protein